MDQDQIGLESFGVRLQLARLWSRKSPRPTRKQATNVNNVDQLVDGEAATFRPINRKRVENNVFATFRRGAEGS